MQRPLARMDPVENAKLRSCLRSVHSQDAIVFLRVHWRGLVTVAYSTVPVYQISILSRGSLM